MKHISIALLAFALLTGIVACSESGSPSYIFGFKPVDLTTARVVSLNKAITNIGAGLNAAADPGVKAVYYSGFAGVMLYEGVAAENTAGTVSLKIYRSAIESCYTYHLRVDGTVYTNVGNCDIPMSDVTVTAETDNTYTFTKTSGAAVPMGGGYSLIVGSSIRGQKY